MVTRESEAQVIDQSSDHVHTTHKPEAVKSLDDFLGSRNRPTVLRRLRWIEDRLWWHGSLRRAEVVKRFGISPQQASQDISLYQHIRPGLAKIDPSSKAYLREHGAEPLFPKDPFRWIGQEMSENAPVLPLERIPVSGRRADPDVMAGLLSAFDAKRPLAIQYQSLSRDDLSARTICPHHLVDANHRCHVRAWDALRGRFADFVVGRIVSVRPCLDYPWVDGLADHLWHEQVAIILVPAPGLSLAQRRAVEQDYEMRQGKAEFRVRKALVTYVADALGVLDDIQGIKNGRANPEVRCANPGELKELVPSRAEG